MTVDPTPPPPPPPVTFKSEVLAIMKEWQAEVATDRGINPTEASGSELYQINNVINMLEAI
jgi:hypothetical protein